MSCVNKHIFSLLGHFRSSAAISYCEAVLGRSFVHSTEWRMANETEQQSAVFFRSMRVAFEGKVAIDQAQSLCVQKSRKDAVQRMKISA